jgi:hypothetical protein
MLKLTSLAIAAVVGASSLIVPQEANLPKRVQELEQWKATAEARIQTLEGMLKAEGKPAASAPADVTERVLPVAHDAFDGSSNARLDPRRRGSCSSHPGS